MNTEPQFKENTIDNYDFLISQAKVLTSAENFKEAEKYYFQALYLKEDSVIYNNLGHLYKKKNDFKNAEKYWLKAINLGNSHSMNALGCRYLSTNKELAKYYFLKANENKNYLCSDILHEL